MSNRESHRLWAPLRKQVAMVRNGNVEQLIPEGNGYFRVPTLDPGDRYAFLCDQDTQPRPDPRSRLQPDGVHGPSQWWLPPGDQRSDFVPVPLSRAVFYELHIGTFTSKGTFDAAIERLPHLVELGVTHVQLMPVNAFMGEFGWGYDGVALFAVHAPYGGPQGLLRFVRECHRHGLAVLMDVVYNHLGPSGNYLAHYGPYFTDRYNTSWGAALNFDGPNSDEVRRFFIDNAEYWIRNFGVDGLRLDAVQAIFDTTALHFLEQLSEHVRELEDELGRPLLLIAESHLNDPRLVRSVEHGGRGMQVMWSDDFHHALHALLSGERDGYYADYGAVSQLAQVLQRGFFFDGRYCPYYQRRHGASAESMTSHQFLVYLQNHDQVGNRAKGDRISESVSLHGLKVGAAATLLGPFVPMIFQGEEWGASSPFPFFADPPDEALAEAIRRGRLREYRHHRWKKTEVPDPVARSTFESSKLRWGELSRGEHAELLSFYRELLLLRSSFGGCAPRESLNVRWNEELGELCFERGTALLLLRFRHGSFELTLGADERVAFASRADYKQQDRRLEAEGPIFLVLQRGAHPQRADETLAAAPFATNGCEPTSKQ